MKVAIFSESSADEAAIRVLINAVLGYETEIVLPGVVARNGWTSVFRLLPAALKYLHYRTDADALAVIVDSDDTSIHQPQHDQVGQADSRCRLCQLRSVINSTTATLQPVVGRTDIKTAIGLAVPAVEAWYLCGVNVQVNEAAWGRKLQGHRGLYDRLSLKRGVYGTEYPTLEEETEKATSAAHRLAGELALLEQLFPNGFGSFVRDVQQW